MKHLSIESLLALIEAPPAQRPAHLERCAECAAEFRRLVAATTGDDPPELAPLRWIQSLAAPETTGPLAEMGRLLFGRAAAPAEPDAALAELHPWFRDFLGEEPAACLAQKMVLEKP